MIRSRFISYFSFSLASAVVGLVTLFYMTKVFSPDDFAYIGIMQILLFLLVPSFGFQAQTLIGIKKIDENEESYINIRNTYLSFSIINILIISLLVISISYFYFYDYIILATLALLISITAHFILLHDQELIVDGKAALFGRLALSTDFVTLITTFFIISLVNITWEGRLLSILMANIIFLILRLHSLSGILDNFRFNFKKEFFLEFIKFGLPLFLVLGANWITFQLDKVIVGYFFSMEQMGLYTVAYNISSFVEKVNRALRNAYAPTMLQYLKGGHGKNKIINFTILYTVFVLLLAIAITMVCYYFDYIIFGESYKGIWKIVLFISLGFAFIGIYGTFGSALEYYKLTNKKAKISIYSAIINISVSLSLIPLFGYIAPAIGTMASLFVIPVAAYIYISKEFKEREVLD
jgi:O-antigen/teichoic acid export membrane protein